jgi:hypothetical protein
VVVRVSWWAPTNPGMVLSDRGPGLPLVVDDRFRPLFGQPGRQAIGCDHDLADFHERGAPRRRRREGFTVNVSMTVRRFGRLILAVMGGLVLAVALAAPASARTPVDPSTLNPPPPAEFNPVCFVDGSNITCDIAFSEPPAVDAPSGIVCGGTELLISFSRSVVGKRFYDADGNLLQRHFREYFDNGSFLNPDTGLVALWTQHDTVIANLAVPGDFATGTEKLSGLETRVWLPGGGTILTDAGLLIFAAGTDEVVKISAHHPFDDYFRLGDPAALAPLCAALA